MRDLRRIRRHLDLDSAKLLVIALMSSHLDYCNSVLYGVAAIDLSRLQRFQNRLDGLVTKSPPFILSLPLLRSLHRLPVRFRKLFKINVLTYTTLHEKQLDYVYSMLAASINQFIDSPGKSGNPSAEDCRARFKLNQSALVFK